MKLMNPVWVDSVGSTNKEVKLGVENGSIDGSGYVFAAKEQFAGRGRFDRVWLTEKGQNLTFSILISTAQSFPKIATIPMATGLGVCKYLISKGVDAKGKWPNDVLVGDNKICGILSEVAVCDGKDYIIVGTGVNLNLSLSKASELEKPATSLLIETGVESNQEQELLNLLPYIEESLSMWEDGGFEGIREEWLKIAWKYHEEVELDNSGSVISGVLVDFAESGQIVLELPGGERKEFWSGDVSIKRDHSQ